MKMDPITLIILATLTIPMYLFIGNKIGEWYATQAREISFRNILEATNVGVESAKDWENTTKRVITVSRYAPIFLWLPMFPILAIEGAMHCPFLRMQF